MANRCTLHESHLTEFRAWLVKDGWTLEPPKGFYEVLRAARPGRRPLIIFRKLRAQQHLSVQDQDMVIVRRFLKERGRHAED